MKLIFIIAFLTLSAASLATMWLRQSEEPDVPVLYWITDPNPARVQQLSVFHQWLEDNGYPLFELRIDTANSDISKLLIQGISGVAGDILDVNTQKTLPYLAEIGLLKNLDESASRMGFGVDKTYPALDAALRYNDTQYGFPCNVNAWMLVVNSDRFKEAGLAPPPASWSLDAFEKLGLEYVHRANANNDGPRLFFCNPLSKEVLRRGYGLDLYNETLTRCVADDPRNTEMLERLYRWTYVDRIMPSPTDLASASSDSGEGRLEYQLFQQGRYAMLLTGRHIVIELREAGLDFNLEVAAPPFAEFKNVLLTARAAGIYQGSRHPELADYFLKFLTSPEYGALIIGDGDGLPPSPKQTETEDFLKPADHPNEWNFHTAFTKAAETIGIPTSISPYISPFMANRIVDDHHSAYVAGLYDAATASRKTAEDINREIERTLQANPGLRDEYNRLILIQERIDQRKAAGEKIPVAWITNPFYRKLYQARGMLEEETSS